MFLYDFLQQSKKRYFRVDSHPQALKASITPPQEVELGQPSTFVVRVSSGRNQVIDASLALVPTSEGISLLKVPSLSYSKVGIDSLEDPVSSGQINFETHEAIALPAFGPNETLEIAVPYESVVKTSEHQVKMVVHYLSPNSKRHTFTLTSSIDAMLPLQVAHSIIWRDNW